MAERKAVIIKAFMYKLFNQFEYFQSGPATTKFIAEHINITLSNLIIKVVTNSPQDGSGVYMQMFLVYWWFFCELWS